LQGTENFKIHITKEADMMFSNRIDFLARTSTSAAVRLIAGFKDKINRIANNPFLYQFADELDVPNLPLKTYRKCVFEDHYKILFSIDGKAAIVEAVIDTRMENKDIF